jgi:hypothetical protein
MPIQLVYPTRQHPERVRLLIEFLTQALGFDETNPLG